MLFIVTINNMAGLDVTNSILHMRLFWRAIFKMAARAIQSWLESRHVYIQNEWLEACIDFVKEDNEVCQMSFAAKQSRTVGNCSHIFAHNTSQERQLTPQELKDLVYEQWLMSDIQESSVPRLPGEVGNVKICKVEGYFNLQVGQLKIT